MAWNKKQAEVAAMLKRCSDKSNEFRTMGGTVLVAPMQPFELENSLGPLTQSFEKQSAINWGIYLYMQASLERGAYLDLVTTIKQKLQGTAAVYKDVSNSMTFATRVSVFTSTLLAEVKKLQELKNPKPVWIGILDTLLIQSVASIPVVGQISGTALQMILQGSVSALDSIVNKGDWGAGLTSAALAGGGATAQVYGDKFTNKNFDGTRTDTGAVILSKEGGAITKADPTKANFILGFIYDLHENIQEKNRDKARDLINEKRQQGQLTGIGLIDSPIVDLPARNNMAIVAQKGLTGKNAYVNELDGGVTDATKEITTKITADSKTLFAYFTTVAKSLQNVINLLEKVRDAAVVSAFYDLNKNFKETLDRVSDKHLDVMSAKNALVLQNTVIDYAACVIAGYFFRKITPEHIKLNIMNSHRWIKDPSVNQQAAQPGNAIKDVKSNLMGMQVKSFDSIQQQLENARFLTLTQNAADLYVQAIKKAVGDTIEKVFLKSPDDTSDIIDLKLTCACIVQQCTARAAAGQDLEIDEKYIGVLEKLKFVNRYTKFFIVTEKMKKSYTEDMTDPTKPIFKLRYPTGKGGLTGSASVNEVGMVYAFAVIVNEYVDLPRLALGLDSWETVKDSLNKAIKTINDASQIQ